MAKKRLGKASAGSRAIPAPRDSAWQRTLRIAGRWLQKGAIALAMAICWLAPLAPAILINLAAVKMQGPIMAAVAIAFVVSGALAVESAFESHDRGRRIISGMLACFFLSANMHTALANVSTGSEQSRGLREQASRSYTENRDQAKKLTAARQAQFDIAGDATPESIEADAQAAKAADAGRWKATEGCNVEKITAGPTKTFCANLAQLAAKKAAAQKRDLLDSQLDTLAKDRQASGAVPESADPAAENLAATLESFGLTVGAKGRKMLSLLSDWKWAVGVEFIAAFIPMLLLSKLRFLIAREDAPLLQPQSKPQAGGKPDDKPAALPAAPDNAEEEPEAAVAERPRRKPAPPADPMAAFLAWATKAAPGSRSEAKEIYTAYVHYIETTNQTCGSALTALSAISFGRRLKASEDDGGFGYGGERVGGKTFYLGIELSKSPVRLVAK